jgi:hypothetical protein
MNELITKDIKIYIVVIVIILGYGFGRLIPPLVTAITEKQTQIKDTSNQVIELEKKKAGLTIPKTVETVKVDLPIKIFKSAYNGTDVESAGMELVYQLLKIVGSTGNKITEIAMVPGAAATAPAPAAAVSGESSGSSIPAPAPPPAASTSFSTLTVNMTIDCSYISMQNLLQKVSTWNYLAEVKILDLKPKLGNPNQLESIISIDLYIGQ